MKLFEGGEGRSDEDVEGDARVCGWLFLALIGLLFLFGLVGCDALPPRENPNDVIKRAK